MNEYVKTGTNLLRYYMEELQIEANTALRSVFAQYFGTTLDENPDIHSRIKFDEDERQTIAFIKGVIW